MWMHPRRALGVLTSSLTLSLAVLLSMPSSAWAAEKARLRVDDYQIEAELEPHLHQITARAKVKFTATQDLAVAVFELHNDLRVTKVTRRKGAATVGRAGHAGFDRARAAASGPGERRIDDSDFRI